MTKMQPLLCELRAHTSWSDGEHSLREVVDLYGVAAHPPRHLPVLADGKLVGMVPVRDLVRVECEDRSPRGV